MQPRPEIDLAVDQKRILHLLRRAGAHSRIELSGTLAINNGVVTRYCKELLSLGLVREAEAQRVGRGRPSLPLHIKAEGAYAIGAAVHPGSVDVAIVDLAGVPIAQGGFSFADGDPIEFASKLGAETTRLTATRNLRRSRFLGFGVSVPGFAGASGAHRHTVERLRSWRGQNLSEVIGEALGSPVWIENDANAAALAEYYADGHSGASMLVLYLGYGVGAGCISDGGLFRGEFFNAGEIGVLYPLDQPRPSALDLLDVLTAQGAGRQSVDSLEGCLEAHYETISRWAQRAADQLELAILSGIAWFDPASVVISGTLPNAILQMILQHLTGKDWLRRLGARRVPSLCASDLRGYAAAVGAGLLPIHQTMAPKEGR